MAKQNISTRAQNFPQWYQDVIKVAPDLYDESPVTGCITFGPLATKLWSKIRSSMDHDLKKLGVENIMLPMLIPQKFFEREKEHVEGFAPECAVVTEAGGAKLPEPYAIRPTSETLFVDWYTRSGRVQSHRDLPLLVNQWCSVMRWEKRPRAFLRTSEFHWQEGHCLFPNEQSNRAFALKILDLYAMLAEDILAIPVIRGDKPVHERFPGGLATYSIEGMMQDGKALQMGTSHVLSQNFLKGSDGKPMVSFLDESEAQVIPHYQSWGASTRLLGALFMTHGDDDGIVLPPKIAPVQCAIIPIFGPDAVENAKVLETARKLAIDIASSQVTSHKSKVQLYSLHGRKNGFEEVSDALTVRIDCRDVRLGDKTFHQIKSGTPVRIEIGPKDLAENSCVIKSRIRTREQAVKAPLTKAPEVVQSMLEEDQKTLFTRAKAMQKERTVEAKTFDEVKKALDEGKWALIAWDGTTETVEKLKAETSGGTYRCFAFDAKDDAKGMMDPVSGKPSAFPKRIYVAKAY
jgi:prolyl-tRNA synthetase